MSETSVTEVTSPVEPAVPILAEPLAGDDLRAYQAMRDSVAVLESKDSHHLEFSGAQAAAALNGLVTNNVLALGVGDGQYAAALTAKGRVVADMRIVRIGEERFLTSVNSAAWPGWRDLVRKFVNPRLAKYTERSFTSLVFYGPDASTAIAGAARAVGGQSTITDLLAPYATATSQVEEIEYLAIRLPALDTIDGFELLVPDSLEERVRKSLEHVARGTAPALNVLRVESGRPEWGRDMDDTTIPQEANLGRLNALSFDKGCYTGQETVARIHFRGHVNRHLRVLMSDTPLAVPAEVRDLTDKPVGDVRSAVISPKYGPVAIAMIRRELEPGAEVQVLAASLGPVPARIDR
jgi:folate-binding protein YgfZ